MISVSSVAKNKMIRARAKSALTLVEMTVVIAIAAVLAGLALPAARMMFRSFESQSGTRSMISSALASARAIAAREQTYAGIRFQKAYDPAGPLDASQYLIFIVHDPYRTDRANGFRAVTGLEPIKLPDTIGVMDEMLIREKRALNPTWELSTNPAELTDLTTFSIVFSPSGRLVIHNVRARNRDGMQKWVAGVTLDNSQDDIFNTVARVTDTVNPHGMFLQDDNAAIGLYEESSRARFIIYETEKFNRAFERGQAWDTYLSKLTGDYMNPYTGTLVSVD